jgi:DNA-binding response OmpR family regulator
VVRLEDDRAILRGLKDILEFERYEVIAATDGDAGYRLALDKKPDLVILDVMLPHMGGFEVCRKLRAEGHAMPILVLTARGEETDRVLGLDLGADDYVTKPFSIRELLARVRALIRRTQALEATLPDAVRFDEVVVDFRRFEAVKRGVPIEMTPKEFGVLRRLAATVGEVVTRDDLLQDVWGQDNASTTRTIDTHIASLRAKLEEDPSAPKRLVTVHGVGYKLTVS